VGDGVEGRTGRVLDRIAERPLRSAWLATAIVSATVTIVAGLLMRVTDPETFPSIGRGLWWAVQTTTTVGYGDVVPASTPGRLIAALVMVVGLGFITVSTAAIASAFVDAARRRRERTGAPAHSEHAELLRRIDDLERAQTGELAKLRAQTEDLARLVARLQTGTDDGGASR